MQVNVQISFNFTVIFHCAYKIILVTEWNIYNGRNFETNLNSLELQKKPSREQWRGNLSVCIACCIMSSQKV